MPDIGDFSDVPVIEIFVKVGDTVKAEDPLVSLESDKATMDVPAPRGGMVKAITVKVGDKVSEGSVIMPFEGDGARLPPPRLPKRPSPASARRRRPTSAPAGVAEVRVPDIGDFKDVPVIEIFVKVGDTVKAEDPLVSLESDKATMDVPAPLAGVVQAIKVKVGDKVSEGSVILSLATGDAAAAAAARAGCAVAAAAPRRRRAGRAAAAPAAASTKPPSRSPTPARRCASSRANSASTSARSRAAATTAASCAPTSRPSPRAAARAAAPAAQGRAGAAAAAAASTCCPGPRSTSPSSARSSARSCRASRRSRRPTCTATGS